MITLQKIQEAHKRTAPFVNYTPLIHSKYLSNNSEVKLKLESLQITGSFKLRGAANKLLSLNKDQKQKGVIAVSTGNHGKGVAYAANILGIKSTIFMSSMVPLFRKKAIEALGAKVEIVGNNSDEGEWLDWHVDKNLDQELSLSQKQETEERKELMHNSMDVLNKREKEILNARRLSEKILTLDDLSKKYNISRERIRQIESKAFEKLQKAMLNAAKSKNLLPTKN